MHRHNSTGLQAHIAPTDSPQGALGAAANSPLHTSSCSRLLGRLTAVWGLGGTMLVLLSAIVYLHAMGEHALAQNLSTVHWLTLAGSVLVIAFIEGFSAPQRRWVPDVIKRTIYLQWHWTPTRLLLAPLYCMSLLHSSVRKLLSAWASVAGIGVTIFVLNQTSQPWSGLIALGVLTGLAWGLSALLLQSIAMLLKLSH